jgi:hypothetical protein
MAKSTGENSPWVLKAREARDAITVSVAEEQLELSRLPYTREQLQTALDSLSKGKAP